jgi:hypothetical protein
MCTATDNPANCRICIVMRHLHAKKTSSAKIHCELRMVVYAQNAMSEQTVRQWCRMFKDEQTNAHNEE